MSQCHIFWHLPRKREEKYQNPHREGRDRNSHLAFWESFGPGKELKEKKIKKVWNNEFIKLKMHRPMERLDFNRRQMEREPPLLLRCSDMAALIAWSCLGGTMSSWAMTWAQQGPGFVARKNCLFNIHYQLHPSTLPGIPVPTSVPLCRGSEPQAAQLGSCSWEREGNGFGRVWPQNCPAVGINASPNLSPL